MLPALLFATASRRSGSCPVTVVRLTNRDRQGWDLYHPHKSASGFLQTALSELTRRSNFRRAQIVWRRLSPDSVLTFHGRNPHEPSGGGLPGVRSLHE